MYFEQTVGTLGNSQLEENEIEIITDLEYLNETAKFDWLPFETGLNNLDAYNSDWRIYLTLHSHTWGGSHRRLITFF